MDRKLIRKLIKNIYSEARYIDTMMELRDWEEQDSAITFTKEENTEIMIMLSQADYLKDYLNNSIDDKVTKDDINWLVNLVDERKKFVNACWMCSECNIFDKCQKEHRNYCEKEKVNNETN